MKITRFLLAAVLAVGITASLHAAPVESVESARASVAFQKVDAFLGEKIVVEHMQTLGIQPAEAHARLAKLSDSQLEELAAQVDLIKAGGTIQSGYANPFGPVGCMLRNLGTLLTNVFRTLFCWRQLE